MTCSKCGEEKLKEEFWIRKGRENGRNGVCRQCKAARWKEDPGMRAAFLESRRNRKQAWINYKGGICTGCGAIGLHPAAYQFHHRDPAQKEFSLSLIRGRGLERTKAELDKCDLLCANCHAIHHANY